MSGSLFISAGELSGDQHAAKVVQALKRAGAPGHLYGLGGDALANEGVELIEHIEHLSVMGIGAVIGKLFFFRRLIKRVLARVDAHPPERALLVDYPGFNIPLARALKARGIPVYWYISPKVWVWKKERIEKMRSCIDTLMVIFPFEVDFFQREGIEAHYVGNPLVEQLRLERALSVEEEMCRKRPYVALLPGSRKQEVVHILPRHISEP